MRKSINIILLLLIFILTSCSNNKNTEQGMNSIAQSTTDTPYVTSEPSKISTPISTRKDTIIVDSDTENKSVIESLYKDFYIGEVCISGFVYIEPFRIERTSTNEDIKFDKYPDSIDFYTIENKNNIYKLIFDLESSIYIPTVEEDSKYYWQGFSEPNQYVLRYKSSAEIDKTSVGITLFNHKIDSINFSCKDKNRIYSEYEYISALDEVKKGKEDRNELEGCLREITIDDTIVGAKQICLISIKNTPTKILLSKYMHMGFENTADVYVVDFINNSGNVIQTYRKYNWIAY